MEGTISRFNHAVCDYFTPGDSYSCDWSVYPSIFSVQPDSSVQQPNANNGYSAMHGVLANHRLKDSVDLAAVIAG
jgi:hypothetical protein